MQTQTRYHIAYTVEGQRWDAHNILSEMIEFEIERLQDCEGATILTIRREYR